MNQELLMKQFEERINASFRLYTHTRLRKSYPGWAVLKNGAINCSGPTLKLKKTLGLEHDSTFWE